MLPGRQAWRRQFSSADLSITSVQYGPFWPAGLHKQLMLWLLMLKSRRHGHFYLNPVPTSEPLGSSRMRADHCSATAVGRTEISTDGADRRLHLVAALIDPDVVDF